ncbi:RHS repeat-associated core domain-containing protein [Maribacter sp. 2-571]|uniref:RHS repeat-associated core domain-containing protein n=1 Tax=Maribacter sp. 2-571 TaxID=3417569 RepID=UPI003D334B32
MKAFIRNTKVTGNALALLFTLAFAICANAQTDYKEVPLKGTPIDINEQGGPTVSLVGPQPEGTQLITTSAANSGGGGGSMPQTMGSLSVSASGAAVYSYPINVPPGINGIVPELSIQYNSQSGDGLVGYGWHLTGVSTITRIPSTMYHNGTIDPVDFDALDRFALDGQRLILKSGTYGANGAVYETEYHSNLRITSLGTSPYGAGFGPEKFKVEYPDGSVAMYADNANSRSETNFAITYWKNPQGVRIDYEYDRSYNQIIISRINYGHRSGETALNSIYFSYVRRELVQGSYVGGLYFEQGSILSNINVSGGGDIYRTYSFTYYPTKHGHQRLGGIFERSADLSQFPDPVIFGYSEYVPQVTGGSDPDEFSISLANVDRNNAEVVPLDFTGNGEMDLVLHAKSKSERDKYWIFEDLGSGRYNLGYEIGTTPFEQMFAVDYLDSYNKMGRSQGYATVTKSGSKVKFGVHAQGGSSVATRLYEKTWTAPSYQANNNCGEALSDYQLQLEYLSGDFNGDGLTDVIALSKPYSYTSCTEELPPPGEDCGGGRPDLLVNGSVSFSRPDPNNECCECANITRNVSTAHFIDLDRRVASGFASTLGNLQSPTISLEDIFTADVNGDGKTDILQFTEGKVYVYSMTDNTSLELLWTTQDTAIKQEYSPILGDYNGDGKTDFMYPTEADGNRFVTFFATGKDFDPSSAAYPFTYKESDLNGSAINAYTLVPTDTNGDGRTDILEYATTTYDNGQNGKQSVRLYMNGSGTDNSSTGGTVHFNDAIGNTQNGPLSHFPIPIFLSSEDVGKGNYTFSTISNDQISSFGFTHNHAYSVRLRAVGMGANIRTIGYGPMDSAVLESDGRPIYTPLSEHVYPYVDLQVDKNTYLVTSITRQYQGFEPITKRFSYQGAVAHVDGLGFQGFSGLARTEWEGDGTQRKWNVSKHDLVAHRGAATLSYTVPYFHNFTDSPTDYIIRTDHRYDTELSPSKVFKLSMTSSTVQDGISGTVTVSGYRYDTYNNPVQISIDHSGQGSSLVELAYNNNEGADYYIGRPTSKKSSSTVDGDTYTKEEEYTYSDNLLTTKRTRGNGTAFDTETYSYDVSGNILEQVMAPDGETPRTMRYTYDPSDRYLVKRTDAEGRSAEYEYNVNSGTLKKETDPYGLTTSYDYDSWFRLTGTTDYLGKETVREYTDSSYTPKVTVNGADGSGMIAEYNILGQMVRSSVKNVMGEWVHTAYGYDALDRRTGTSEPFKGDSPQQWNTTAYDLYGRPEQVVAHTGETTNITYSGLVTTIDDGTMVKVVTSDAMGNIKKVTDPGGTIDYTYYGNGNLKSSNFGGSIIRMEQDGWGRRSKLIDPSAGTYSYEYNGFGQVLKETNPKGLTEYKYTPEGRLERKTIVGDAGTDMTMDYDYNSDKQLRTLTLTNADGNSGTTVYDYDDTYKWLKRSVETTPYAVFTKRFAYDSYGRVSAEESEALLLANGERSVNKTKNTYAYGQLLQVNDFTSGEELWKIKGLNARGQVTSSTMGNGMERANEYDAHGYLTASVARRESGTTTAELMALTYEFDVKRGILNNRSNSLFDWEETFTFDELDRLVSIEDNEGGDAQAYDDKGRITNLASMGDFTYAGNSFMPNGISFNARGTENYADYTSQNITYNAFKSATEIEEAGRDRIGFQYNAVENRANAFYGSTEEDMEKRPYRRHYSQDGSMEISWDDTKGTTRFTTYIGGDAYSSSAIWHSERTASGTQEEYLYLHRDHLGSILGITDKNGGFREKRHFDAWGNIVKWTDGDGNDIVGGMAGGGVLDRGYTGHEHLFGVGLIHMNGRLYDPMLHRFLMPDNFVQEPYNTQNYNRYSYVLNNPLGYIDISGESFWRSVGGWFKRNSKIITFVATVAVAVVATVATAGMASPLLAGVIVGGAAGFTAGAVGSWTQGDGFLQGVGNGLVQGAIGAVSGGIGAGAGALAAKHIGGVIINGIRNNGAAIKGLIGGAIGGGAGSFAGGATTAALTGSSFRESLSAGWQQVGTGMLLGGLTGMAQGFKVAKGLEQNPWNGGPSKSSLGKLRNAKLAGNVHPKTGVPFDESGFPNFKDHLYKGGKNDVFIQPTGTRPGDVAAANAAAGYNVTPKGNIWHHHQMSGRMQLVDKNIHRATGHTGGFFFWGN